MLCSALFEMLDYSTSLIMMQRLCIRVDDLHLCQDTEQKYVLQTKLIYKLRVTISELNLQTLLGQEGTKLLVYPSSYSFSIV